MVELNYKCVICLVSLTVVASNESHEETQIGPKAK